MGDRAELRAAFYSLLESRGLRYPDGRPLYTYRFARADYDQVHSILKRFGPSAVFDRYGAALVVAYVAEWFRRERTGGHWDWIRPLRSVGYDYGPYERIQYRDIESLVSTGLAVWRRPEPSGGERLLGIVREAGFPVASVREDPRISSWLKNAVRSAEKGFSPTDAVGMEAWRVSDRLAQALFEPATELCDKIVELRACLPPPGVRGDPVDYLDQKRSNWRNELPFDVECEDIRTMVEEIVRLREDGAAALDVVRTLFLCDDGEWCPRASLGLAGRVDLRRLPAILSEAVRSGRRLRIFPRPPFCEELIAVAAIETIETDDEVVHELRPFVATFEAPLAFADEARLVMQSGNNTIGEFIAAGGEALLHPIIALQVEQLGEDGAPKGLRVLGTSPAQTARPVLALAIREEYFHAVSFSEGFTDLGRCTGSDHRIVSFSGTATAVISGTRWVWRTAADRDIDGRLVLVGGLMPNLREAVFRSVPEMWIERDGHLSTPRRQSLHWRPRGRGSWREIDKGKPWGNVDLAVIDNGELRYAVGASIVPPNFQMEIDRRKGELRIAGLQTRTIAARSGTNLKIRFENECAVVALGPPTRAAAITVTLRWDAELQSTFADPRYELRLIDQSDLLVQPRAILSVDGLRGPRLIAAREVSLCMELSANDVRRLSITRTISGEVPLSAFAETIIQLLGSSESLDARVRLSALGASERIADVRWYDDEIDPFNAPSKNAFAVLGSLYQLEVQAICLGRPALGTVRIEAPANQAAMRSELSAKLPPGPWLIFGRRRGGTKIRPRIVPSPARKTTTENTDLERAIEVEASDLRESSFLRIYSKPELLSLEDRRTIIDLLVLSRNEGLPISSLDALRLLGRCPKLAVLLLASCDSLTERAALLDLQRELPFLWCSTSIHDWLEAFSSNLRQVGEKLAAVGIDDGTVAVRSVSIALDDIVGLRPDLAGHAKFVFLCIAAEMARQKKPVDGTALHLRKTRRSDGIRREVDRLISRHDEDTLPPQDIFSSKSLSVRRLYFEPYNASFAQVIAAPLLVADHATRRVVLDEREVRHSRDAWLYDPEYFETVLPIGIDEALHGFDTKESARA
ncbi:MAG TPA: STY4851/ECs_5259 family protein [Bradyrhizobium sp.]|nr:STY4851/ECs_5259 family protein [Bradyrhizobium sp.]